MDYNKEEQTKLYNLSIGKLLFFLISILLFTVVYFSFKLYSDFMVKTIISDRKIFNQCFFNSDNNIGCIAYIDNLRNQNKNFNYDKPLKALSNLSVEKFETNYIIVLKNVKTGKIFGKYHFYFFKNQKFVSIWPFNSNDENLKEVNKNILFQLFNGEKITIKLLYSFVLNGKYLYSYNYSSKNIMFKQLTGKGDNKKYVFKKGFQFIQFMNIQNYSNVYKLIIIKDKNNKGE